MCEYDEDYFELSELDEEIDGELEETRNMVREVVRQVGICDNAVELFMDKCQKVIHENNSGPKGEPARDVLLY